MQRKSAILMLANGIWFKGVALGAAQETGGEVVFNTSMCGYQEILTDPSYHGQMITFTSPHIGNYGITPLDDESPMPTVAGAIMHEMSPFTGHWRAEIPLDDWLRAAGITGIGGIDTRALTLHLREHGSINGIISARDSNLDSLLEKAQSLPLMAGLDLAKVVSCKEPYTYKPRGTWPSRGLRVAVYDYGVKRSILEYLAREGMEVTVWPAQTPASVVLASNPHGVFLSNGPGDPEPCDYAIRAVQELLGKIPLFGICLGHQLLGLALGGKTYKLKFGHRGANHPVRDVESGRVAVTSQNHGFCVDPASLDPEMVTVSHWNLNDGTVEGLRCTHAPAFSVQHHPEAAPGPHDELNQFSAFRQLIERWQTSPQA